MSSTRAVTPRLRLMCALARASLRDADLQALEEGWGAAELDLRTLPVSLHQHGLVPLASRHLRDPRMRSTPSAIALWLTKAARETEAMQARAVRRLVEVLDACAAASLDVLPYKGPLLGLQLYGDVSLRQPGDLDLLVRPAHAPAVIALLLTRGFLADDGFAADGRVPLMRHRHACGLRDPEAGVTVEVHWRLLDRLYGPELSIEWLMEQPEHVAVGNRGVRVLDGERLLLALCLHGAAHQWERLIWLADVAELLRSEPDLDWPFIERRVAELRFTRNFAGALILVRELFGDAAPWPEAAAWMRDRGAQTFANSVLARFDAPTAAPLGMAERFRLGWLGRETVIDRAVFGWRAATHLSSRDLGASKWARVTGVATTRRMARLLRDVAAVRKGT